jgi:hypothetical protein
LLQVEFKANFQAEGDVALILKYYPLENPISCPTR